MAERLDSFDIQRLALVSGHLADSLFPIRDELPEHCKDVQLVIDTLAEMQGMLREFGTQCQDVRFSGLDRGLVRDIGFGIGNCRKTLTDLDGIVLRCDLSRRGLSPRSAKRSWSEINSSFRNMEGYPLQTRLEEARTFLFNTVHYMRIFYSSSLRSKKTDAKQIRERIQLIAAQQEKAAARIQELAENHNRAIEEQAYKMRFAHQPIPPLNPLPTPPLHSYDRSPPRRSFSVPVGGAWQPPPVYTPVDRYPPYPLPMYDRPMTPGTPISPISMSQPLTPPMGPTRRYSNTPAPQKVSTPPSPPLRRSKSRMEGRGAQSAPAPKQSGQWWTDVFALPATSTMLAEPPRQGSVCYGIPMENLNMAPEEHEIFRVSFDHDLMLRMFRNSKTEQAKVVCTTGGGGSSWSSGKRNGGYTFQTFIDASLLSVVRVGSGIHLMRKSMVWAMLYFADYETMVLFYHAFLALRSRGPNAPITKDSEYWLEGESLMFSAPIENKGFNHSLRLLKDRDSGSIRLAAAEVDGDHDVTIWTAFITDNVASSNFAYQIDSKTVAVHDIRQFSFSSFFETNIRSTYELRFAVPQDARAFTNILLDESKTMNQQKASNYRYSPPGTLRNSYF